MKYFYNDLNISTMPYHLVIEDPERDWFPAAPVCVQVLADHLYVGVLTHLVRAEDAERDMASATKDGSIQNTLTRRYDAGANVQL